MDNIVADHYQIKFHVSQKNDFTYRSLIDPDFINAESQSLLQKVLLAYKKTLDEKVQRRFYFVTPWSIDPKDQLAELISNNSGELLLDKLFDGKKRSEMAKLRLLWCNHLGLESDEELKEILRPLRIVHSYYTANRLLEHLNINLKSLNLKPIETDSLVNCYSTLIRNLYIKKINSFSKESLKAICASEKLFLSDGKFEEKMPVISNLSTRQKRNINFSGRDSFIKDLRKELCSGKNVAIIQAILGLGGVGKTQIVGEYAYRYHDRYNIVWWIRSENLSVLLADFFELGAAIGIQTDKLNIELSASLGTQFYSEEYSEKFHSLLNAIRIKLENANNYLLIFDNALLPEDLYNYLPQNTNGHILITSRNQNWSEIAHESILETFSEEEAIGFILKRTRSNSDNSAKELSELLGYLPLALEQACAYISTQKINIGNYIELYREHSLFLLSKAPKSLFYKYTVATTWEICLIEIEKDYPHVLALFQIFSFLVPDSIELDLIDIIIRNMEYGGLIQDPLILNELVSVLLRYSLIQRVESGLSVHRLVQDVVRDRIIEGDKKIILYSLMDVIGKYICNEDKKMI